jgi:hypothetical protein
MANYVRCIRCNSETIYYRDNCICCVNPSCKKEFSIRDYYYKLDQQKNKETKGD